MRTVLSADIGGTNTRFILTELTGNAKDSYDCKILFAQKYRNKDYIDFSDVLKQFLIKDAKIDPKNPPLAACFAVAGPINNNKVVFTNRVQWSINGELLALEFNIPQIRLINDFLAVGYGLLSLKEDVECVCIQANEKDPSAPIAVIGPGTGLGECFLTPENGTYSCFSSEGGHAEFAPRNELEVELLNFLKKKFNQKHRVSVERVVSGRGLANIYEFLSEKFPEKVDPDIHKRILDAGEMQGAIIAANTSHPLCAQTMDIFAAAFGAEAGVAAAKWMPFGGLYLTGGLTPKNIDVIKNPDGPFQQAFFDKGRVSGFLKSIPIYAVLVEDVGERGAQFCAIGLTHTKGVKEEEVEATRSRENSNNVVSPDKSFTQHWFPKAFEETPTPSSILSYVSQHSITLTVAILIGVTIGFVVSKRYK